MAANLSVHLSGPVLSFIFYDVVSSQMDQEGFLLGELVSQVIDMISDSQMCGEKMETLVNVTAVLPCKSLFTFYNSLGQVKPDQLNNLLTDKAKHVVGWYRFRRNTSLDPYMREQIVHAQLPQILPRCSPETFILCLINSGVSASGATHAFDHAFLRTNCRKYESVPLRIHNLGDTSQSKYKLVSATLGSSSSQSFRNIVGAFRMTEDTPGGNLVWKIQHALQDHLHSLVEDVESSEARICSLEQELRQLKEKLKMGTVSQETLLTYLVEDPKTTDILDTTPSEKPDTGTLHISEEVGDPDMCSQEEEDLCSASSKVLQESKTGNDDPFGFITDVMKMSRENSLKKSNASGSPKLKRSSIGPVTSSNVVQKERSRFARTSSPPPSSPPRSGTKTMTSHTKSNTSQRQEPLSGAKTKGGGRISPHPVTRRQGSENRRNPRGKTEEYGRQLRGRVVTSNTQKMKTDVQEF